MTGGSSFRCPGNERPPWLTAVFRCGQDSEGYGVDIVLIIIGRGPPPLFKWG
jgi:hypothetical protein